MDRADGDIEEEEGAQRITYSTVISFLTSSAFILSTSVLRRILCATVPAQTMGKLSSCHTTIHLHKEIKHLSCDSLI